MPRAQIDTAAKRAKLAPRKNPYWHGVAGGRGGASLGYRKAGRGPGTWIAKLVIDGRRVEERLGSADDPGAPTSALPYPAAAAETLAWARRQYARLEGRAGKDPEPVPTVRSAITRYLEGRKGRTSRADRETEARLRLHVLSDGPFADTPIAKLSSTGIAAWRARLPPTHKQSTINRLLNDVRAALNGAAVEHRLQMPGHIVSEIKVGTKAAPAATGARQQVLSDQDVSRLVEAAYQSEPDPDFGNLVLVAAATGARFSQIVRIRVGDVQATRCRIMVPSSFKGKDDRPRAPIAVPVGADVIERLQPILNGRAPGEPLLIRWVKRQVGPFTWERVQRRPWMLASEVTRPWAKLAAAGDLPGTVMLSLRHSSIVRGLRAGLPIRLVAALHDTSVKMIEEHYAAFIVDATEELARRAVLPLAPVPPV